MHTVIWTFQLPADISKTDAAAIIQGSAASYQGVPGLIRKYYGLTEDGTSLVGIYLWESKAKADAFYTTDWIAKVNARWKSTANRKDWETPMVVESAERRLVAAAE